MVAKERKLGLGIKNHICHGEFVLGDMVVAKQRKDFEINQRTENMNIEIGATGSELAFFDSLATQLPVC